MRKITLIFVMFLTAEVSAQELYVAGETGKLTHERIVELPGMTAADIHKKAKVWFTEYFRSSKDVIRGEVEGSMIKGTFITTYIEALNTPVEYENDIVVRIKDGAIKVTIDNIRSVSGYPLETTMIKMDGTLRKGAGYVKLMKSIEQDCVALVNNLAASLEKPQSSDW